MNTGVHKSSQATELCMFSSQQAVNATVGQLAPPMSYYCQPQRMCLPHEGFCTVMLPAPLFNWFQLPKNTQYCRLVLKHLASANSACLMTGVSLRRMSIRLTILMKHGVCIFYLLDHDGDVLVQIAAVELHQVYKNVKKIRGETDVHPQENEAG